jgi:hypothetical protein
MFHNVRVTVMDKTNGDQVRWTEDGIQRRQRVLFGGVEKMAPTSLPPRPVDAQQPAMTFFVTSVGKGDGANLGGLTGADAHCASLAKAAGSTKTRWKAYLSTTAPGGAGVSARERIGKGP